MNLLPITVPLAGPAAAVLTLLHTPTLESLAGLEQSLATALGPLRRDLGDRASNDGAIEYASWAQYLRPAAA